MLLFWRIRYLDRQDRIFKDRDLWLATDELDAVIRAAIETCDSLSVTGHNREMLRYRHLFQEQTHSADEMNTLTSRHQGFRSFCLVDYFEDENGKELNGRELAAILTGKPDAILLPAGAKQHDINYALSDKCPIPLEVISLSEESLKVLGYFARDLREMLASAFWKDGPGSLSGCGSQHPALTTAVTHDEIRSFLMIFRRLYMENEPGNLLKAADLFVKATDGYAISAWVKGAAGEYQANLSNPPDFMPFVDKSRWTFTRKSLIDVYFYTQYLHQPDSRRDRQYKECLQTAGGKKATLDWLFLTEIWKCCIDIINPGRMIAAFYDAYCLSHKTAADVIASIADNNSGLGIAEKKEAREQRIIEEKAEELAKATWVAAGRPAGGHTPYFQSALEKLKAALGRGFPVTRTAPIDPHEKVAP